MQCIGDWDCGADRVVVTQTINDAFDERVRDEWARAVVDKDPSDIR